MPAFSRDVHEEGVLFDAWLLVRDGRLREEETRALLTGARYPSRNPETNLADLRAQIAANARGIAEVERMIAHFGLDVRRAPTWGTCRTTRRRPSGGSSTCSRTAPTPTRWTPVP